MKRLLLSPDGDAGLPASETNPEPPAAAKVVATGKSELEAELERELEVSRTEKANLASAKLKLEKDLCHLQDENAQLKAVVLPAPETREKISWMGFGKE